jgi:hypothetical protein
MKYQLDKVADWWEIDFTPERIHKELTFMEDSNVKHITCTSCVLRDLHLLLPYLPNTIERLTIQRCVVTDQDSVLQLIKDGQIKPLKELWINTLNYSIYWKFVHIVAVLYLKRMRKTPLARLSKDLIRLLGTYVLPKGR